MLQPESKAQKVSHRRPRPMEGDAYNERSNTRQVKANIGRTLQGRPLSQRESHHLKDLDGNKLPRPWNVEHLKRYYE